MIATTAYEVGNGRIELAHGDIIHFLADAIVSPIEPELALRSESRNKVQQSIFRYGGQKIFDDLVKERERYESMNPGARSRSIMRGEYPCFVTTAGNLQFRKILHSVSANLYRPRGVATYDESSIFYGANNIFTKCVEHHIKSVAFPPIGVESGKISASKSAAFIAVSSVLNIKLSVAGQSRNNFRRC